MSVQMLWPSVRLTDWLDQTRTNHAENKDYASKDYHGGMRMQNDTKRAHVSFKNPPHA